MDDTNLNMLYEEAKQKHDEHEERKRKYWENVKPRLLKLMQLCRGGIIQSPKGLFVKRCPLCESKLSKWQHHEGLDTWKWYQCPTCEYEACIYDEVRD